MYDVIVIGCGVSGASVGYFLSERGKRVLLFDKKNSLESGASGAAGAFLSPMLGSDNPIKKSVNSALAFALPFYAKHIPSALVKKGVLRISEDASEQESAKKYEASLEFPFEYLERARIRFPHLLDDGLGSYFFEEGGILDTKKTLEFFIKDCDVRLGCEVTTIKKEGGVFVVTAVQNGCAERFLATSLVLAQGWEEPLFAIPYISIRKIWGQRLELAVQNPPPSNIHKGISLSAPRGEDGTIALGATSIRDKSVCFKSDCDPLCPLYVQERSTAEDPEISELLEKGRKLYDLGITRIVATYCGIRSASSDYLPICGELIDVGATMEDYPTIKNGYFPKGFQNKREQGIYFIGGLGARGFVYAPLSAKYLSEYILDNKEIPLNFSIDRMCNRWYKKSGKTYLS